MDIALNGACVFWVNADYRRCTDKALLLKRFCRRHYCDMRPDMSADGCIICGGPIQKRNASRVCDGTARCRSEGTKLRHRQAKKQRPPHGGRLLCPAFDLDTGDEIVDHEAVRIAVGGVSKVRLTAAERNVVVRRLVCTGLGVGGIAGHIGADVLDVYPILAELGYEVIRDKMLPRSAHSRVIVTATRRRMLLIRRVGRVHLLACDAKP